MAATLLPFAAFLPHSSLNITRCRHTIFQCLCHAHTPFELLCSVFHLALHIPPLTFCYQVLNCCISENESKYPILRPLLKLVEVILPDNHDCRNLCHLHTVSLHWSKYLPGHSYRWQIALGQQRLSAGARSSLALAGICPFSQLVAAASLSKIPGSSWRPCLLCHTLQAPLGGVVGHRVKFLWSPCICCRRCLLGSLSRPP